MMKFIRWLGGIFASIISAVAIYYMTEGRKEIPEHPERGLINFVYPVDYYGCNLPISIKIGDKSFYPKSNLHQEKDIELGEQKYTIQGQISCPTIGVCQVYGEGSINVISGNNYYLYWKNTSYGQCTAWFK